MNQVPNDMPLEAEKLLRDLNSPDDETRIKAARNLGRLEVTDATVVTYLVGQLQLIANNDSNKLAREFATNSILKLTGQKKETPAYNVENIKKPTSPEYNALKLISSIFSYLGWIVLILGILGSVAGALIISSENIVLAVFIFIGGCIISSVTALPLLAAEDLISLFVNLASDARESKLLLDKLVEGK